MTTTPEYTNPVLVMEGTVNEVRLRRWEQDVIVIRDDFNGDIEVPIHYDTDERPPVGAACVVLLSWVPLP